MNKEGFFDHLYEFCDENEKIELRAFSSGKSAAKPVFCPVSNLENIEVFCKHHSKANLFLGVATRDGGGGRKDNIVHIPAVWSDVDYKETPREALAHNLSTFPFKPSIIVKSGGGAHLYWILKEPAGKECIPQIEDVNRRIAAKLGGDLNSCDAARILRIPETVNHKYSEKPICEVVKVEQFFYKIDDFSNELPPSTESREKDQKTTSRSSQWLEDALKGVGKGERNATGAKIAGYFINKNSPQEVLAILDLWNGRNDPPLSKRELESVVKSVSRYETDKSLKKVDVSHIYAPPRMLSEYRSYVRNLEKNRFITGINEIDKRIRGVAGGEVLTIIARTGSFKTAMLQNMLKNYGSNSAWCALFFSIEMPVASVAERYHQIVQGACGKDIAHFYRSKETGVEKHIRELENDFLRELKNLYVVPVKVGVPDIVGYVKLIESNYKVKIGVVGIDYLGLMDSPGNNEYEAISRLSRDIKTMAKAINLPMVLLSQVTRKGGEGEEEVTLDMGRGSGGIEEGADFVLSLWQVERKKLMIENPEPEYDLICRILKNRKGPRGSRWKLDLDPENFRIGPEAEFWEPKKRKNNF